MTVDRTAELESYLEAAAAAIGVGDEVAALAQLAALRTELRMRQRPLGFDTAIADARAAVKRSEDGVNRRNFSTLADATQAETLAIRDALRALIQAVEALGA